MIGELLKYKTIGFNYIVEISVEDIKLRSVYTTEEEKYSLDVEENNAEIHAGTYVGFVRGLETFLQTFTCNKRSKNCSMAYLPIKI